MKGKLVMVDGPDGSGKSFVMKGLERWAKFNGQSVFDLRSFESEHNRVPEYDEIKEFDIILSCEPTLAWVGRVIKNVLINIGGPNFSGLSIAQAFALDREILYKQLLIPALDNGKLIFQERGVITSFVYQPLQIHIPLTELMNLPGNKLALKYAPSLIIICTVEPEYIMARIHHKKNSQIFEQLSFLRKVHTRYRSEWLQSLFAKFGTKFAYIDTTPPHSEEDTISEAKKIWEEF